MLSASTVCSSSVENSAAQEKKFSPTVVDGRHRHPCIEKLVSTGQLATKWASQLIWMTVIRAFYCEVRTDRMLLKLISFATMVSGLVLPDTSITALIRSLVRYSKTSD